MEEEKLWLRMINKLMEINEKVDKVAMDTALIRESIIPIKEHIIVINDELGEVYKRLDSIEKNGSPACAKAVKETMVNLCNKLNKVDNKVDHLEKESIESQTKRKVLEQLVKIIIGALSVALVIVSILGALHIL